MPRTTLAPTETMAVMVSDDNIETMQALWEHAELEQVLTIQFMVSRQGIASSATVHVEQASDIDGTLDLLRWLRRSGGRRR